MKSSRHPNSCAPTFSLIIPVDPNSCGVPKFLWCPSIGIESVRAVLARQSLLGNLPRTRNSSETPRPVVDYRHAQKRKTPRPRHRQSRQADLLVPPAGGHPHARDPLQVPRHLVALRDDPEAGTRRDGAVLPAGTADRGTRPRLTGQRGDLDLHGAGAGTRLDSPLRGGSSRR